MHRNKSPEGWFKRSYCTSYRTMFKMLNIYRTNDNVHPWPGKKISSNVCELTHGLFQVGVGIHIMIIYSSLQ